MPQLLSNAEIDRAVTVRAHTFDTTPEPTVERGTKCPSDRYHWALVADVDPVYRTRLTRSFEDAGLKAFGAGSDTEALQLAEAHGPGFLATAEVKMGSCSGLRLLEELRRKHQASRTVIVSSYPSFAGAVKATRLGIDGYLAKPTTATAVFDVLSAEWNDDEHAPARPPTRAADAGDWLTLERAKWEYISYVVASSRSLAQAARRLGLQVRSLRRMLQKYPPVR